MTKIDIVSGFLGAGKTTFIKKMLKESFLDEQVVLIENEFGEIGIDGGFLKDSGIQIREMNSGCICCSLVGDFGKSLKEVVDTYHPDRILIEPSGVGKLLDVIKAVQGVQEEIDAKLNSFITVVDVMKCRLYHRNFGEFFSNQITYAGAIILSRTDKAKQEKIEESIAILRELNKKAPIITTPIEQLSGEKLLETMEGNLSLEEELMSELACPICGDHHHHHDHHHDHHQDHCECEHDHHHADEVFTSWGCETTRKYTKEQVENILVTLEQESIYGTILRAKGMVAAEAGEWIYFDFVPEEYEIRSGAPEYTGRICVIGSQLEEQKLKELFEV